MKLFVFSADSHIQEPEALHIDGLPAKLKRHALQVRKDGDYLIAGTDEKVIHRLRLGKHRDIPHFAERRGTRELAGRFEDMDIEGVDAVGHNAAKLFGVQPTIHTGQKIAA